MEETKNASANEYKPLTSAQIDGAIAFHGHFCPGLAIGLRAGEVCLNELGRAGDEEIVVVTETDMCGADAVQFLTGCTFGKGNFIFRETGKVAFTFYRRSDGKRFRIALNPDFAADLREKQESLDPNCKNELIALRQERTNRFMKADWREIFRKSVPTDEIPSKARVHRTVRCTICDEGVMETRIVNVGEKKLCVDCARRIANAE